MQVITFESEAYKNLIKKLEAIEASIVGETENPEHKWLDNQEFCQLLNVSKRTAQNYRDHGLVAFSQIGSKVYYKLADVHALLETNRVAPLRVGRQ